MPSQYPPYNNSPANLGPYRYPPANGPYGTLPSSSMVNLADPTKKDAYATVQVRGGLRTPSPTPSEAEELTRSSPLDWNKLKSPKFWFRKEWIWYYIAIIIVSALVALITIYHHQIVQWLTPIANKLKAIPAGWVIPIGILFVISFPPLFGHEIVAVLCGVVWGLWIGFGIVALGTFIGEVGNFYAFKWCCRARAEKLEKTNITYGVLARVVREGGFKIALIARLSAIPGHFTTAVFSSCGMGIFVFSLAAILSLPKQFVTVYLGVLLEGVTKETTAQRIASYAVVAVTVIITVLAMWYIYRQMAKAKPGYIYDRRKARQGKLAEVGMSSASFSQSTVTLSAPGQANNGSDIALNSFSPTDPEHQQWDASGRAVGHAGDPRLHAPAPRVAANGRAPTFRTEGGGGFSATGERYEQYDGPGVSYPTSPRADGRIPVRQTSWGDDGDVVGQKHASIVPPLHNPFDSEPSAPTRTGPAASSASYPAAVPSSAPPHMQSRPQSPPQQSASAYDAAYDYNPAPYSAHPYAQADRSQTRWSASGSNGVSPFSTPPPLPPVSAPAATGAASPHRVLSPPPSYR